MLTLRLSDEEHARLERCAKDYGITSADVVRMLVKRDFDLRWESDGTKKGRKR